MLIGDTAAANTYPYISVRCISVHDLLIDWVQSGMTTAALPHCTLGGTARRAVASYFAEHPNRRCSQHGFTYLADHRLRYVIGQSYADR